MQQPDTYSPDTNTKLREEIDAELAILYDRIRVLHTKRNTLSLLYRLPHELLVRIAREYQEDITHDYAKEDAKKFRAWTKVLQISHHLREIVLHSPELWSDIVIADRRWVSMFVEHSGSHDLNVQLSPNSEQRFLKPLKQVMMVLERISVLSLSINQHDWEKLLAAFKAPAPRLITLALHICSNSSKSAPSLPTDLFSQTHPKLRCLAIISCDMDLTAPLFTKTHLVGLSISPKNVFPISDVLLVLRCQPALRSLCLCHALTRVEALEGHPVHLPNLTSLKLTHQIDSEVNNDFLASLILPETADIDLSYHASEFVIQNLVDAIDAVKIATQNPFLVFCDIDLVFNGRSIGLTCMKQPRSRLRKLSLPLTRLKLNFGFDKSIGNQEEWFIRLPKWLLAPLEVLRLYSSQFESQEIWGYLSHNIPTLTQLCLRDEDLEPLIQCLSPSVQNLSALSPTTTEQDAEPGREVVLAFPALRRLLVCHPSYECLLALSQVLATRKQHGLGLDELSISPWNTDEVEVEMMFKDRVEVLRWVEFYDAD